MHIYYVCLLFCWFNTDQCIQPQCIQSRSLNKAAMLGSSSALQIVANSEAMFLRQIMLFFRAWLKLIMLSVDMPV